MISTSALHQKQGTKTALVDIVNNPTRNVWYKISAVSVLLPASSIDATAAVQLPCPIISERGNHRKTTLVYHNHVSDTHTHAVNVCGTQSDTADHH
uniref:Uncharacterized protein n=1 Tax=Anopheles stephensi TaxID=30069 RepID=A0A182YRC7_ANOST